MTTSIFKGHFQVAYVAADAKQATERLGTHFGIANWSFLDMKAAHGAESAVTRIGMAWVGDMMIEVIEPDPVYESIYQGWLKGGSSPLRFHHLGYFVDSKEALAAIRQQLIDQGHPIVMEGSFGDLLDFAYADTTAELGHYCEFIRPSAEGRAFFDQVPVN